MRKVEAVAGILLVAAMLIGAGAVPAGARTIRSSSGLSLAGCAHRHPGEFRCYLRLRPQAHAPRHADAGSCPVNEQGGYTPCNLQDAYGLTSLSAKRGKRETVAIVDAMDDPSAEADMGVYRSTYGLRACTTDDGCFEKVNQEGTQGSYPTPDPGWASEISLDLDMVSAICPKCHVLLVEADSSGFGDMLAAEHEAISLGATVVSNSWGTGEFDGETGFDPTLDAPGVAITFSSGDGAYQAGVQYPSASPFVTSVGGSALTPSTNKRGWREKTWVTPGRPPTQGSGSGCSGFEAKPGWQTDSGCTNRTTADVSAVAADVLGYDTYQASGWYYFFGTSVSSPIVAAVYGLAGNASSTQTPASLAYGNPTKLHDVTSGKTGTCSPSYLCSAAVGYDGPTGLGTPKGTGAF